ncbi:hypothetical protein [Nocardiopsis tropica]|uniref:Uncharacterized protein n=1 Tax=Nocardiopsis tropica TaxID=109330 RepID=A0ABU7KYJ7_9ACTN|nr:hypothetical protein [Nocardiopsis umidischolae]MEE2054356.1 hypothetical protein [Nocardiopsis umidischolae]
MVPDFALGPDRTARESLGEHTAVLAPAGHGGAVPGKGGGG